MWILLSLGAAPVMFDEALALAEKHPGVTGAEAARAERAPLDATLSSLSANPLLQVTPGWRWAQGAPSGFDAAVQVVQSWTLGGLGDARRDAAQAEAKALLVAGRARALEHRLGAARAWLEVWSSERELLALNAARAVGVRLLQMVKAGTEAGVMLAADASETEAYVEEVELAYLDAEGRHFEHQLSLAENMGVPPDAIATGGAPPQPRLPDPRDWPAVIERAATLPEAQLSHLLALVARTKALEARAQAGWQLQTGASVAYEPSRQWIGGLVLGVSPPWFEANQRARAQAATENVEAEHQARATLLRARHRLALALHEVEHTRDVEDHLVHKLLPAVERAATLRENGLAVGEGSVFTVLRARQEALATQRRLIVGQRERLWAEVKAWLLLAQLQGVEP